MKYIYMGNPEFIKPCEIDEYKSKYPMWYPCKDGSCPGLIRVGAEGSEAVCPFLIVSEAKGIFRIRDSNLESLFAQVNEDG